MRDDFIRFDVHSSDRHYGFLVEFPYSDEHLKNMVAIYVYKAMLSFNKDRADLVEDNLRLRVAISEMANLSPEVSMIARKALFKED